MTHFTWNSKIGKANILWQKEDQWLPETQNKGEWLQRDIGKFRSSGNILYLDWDAIDYTCIQSLKLKQNN